MRVHLLHGIVDQHDTRLRTHRLCVSKSSFVRHLRSGLRYRRLEELLSDKDNVNSRALTIDDSTIAGVEACIIARDMGHEVTFFVNAEPITTQVPYFFSLFDAIIDRRTREVATFEGIRVRLDCPSEVRNWWNLLRKRLMHLDAADSFAQVKEIGAELGCRDEWVPSHLLPATEADLRQLRDAGVQIENHGWSHRDISTMDHASFRDHVEGGRNWLRSALGVNADWYATPFGISEVRPEWQDLLVRSYFLANRNRGDEIQSLNAINRCDISGSVLRGLDA